MFIRLNDPSLNKNLGKFQLSHIWDEALHDIHASISDNALLLPIYNGPLRQFA